MTPLTHSGDRERLIAEQAALARAVTGTGAAPAGFDVERVQVMALSLRTKRLRTVARTWPRLAAALGEPRFRDAFLEFTQQHPLPPSALPFDDALAFARWYEQQHSLPDAARLDWLAAEMRRGPWPRLRVLRLRDSRRLAVLLRLPGLGVRVWRF